MNQRIPIPPSTSSRVPRRPRGGGSAGISTIPAREDHQHPLYSFTGAAWGGLWLTADVVVVASTWKDVLSSATVVPAGLSPGTYDCLAQAQFNTTDATPDFEFRLFDATNAVVIASDEDFRLFSGTVSAINGNLSLRSIVPYVAPTIWTLKLQVNCLGAVTTRSVKAAMPGNSQGNTATGLGWRRLQ